MRTAYVALSYLIFAIQGLAASPSRVSEGVYCTHDLREVVDGLVLDKSGRDDPMHLRIESKGKSTTTEAGMRFDGKLRLVASQADSRRLTNRIQETQAITVEVWLRTDDLKQTGPARIVTLSRDSSNRNFTLGQDRNAFSFRLRRDQSDKNGLPATEAKWSDLRGWKHVVVSRRPDRRVRLFVDGNLAGEAKHGGELAGWDSMCRFAIGDEISGGRGWKGELAMVAVYDRGLSQDEIKQNFAAGMNSALTVKPEQPDPRRLAELHFERHIAPMLAEHCLECHDSAAREGGLDLSRRAEAFVGGDSGATIVPGSAADSLLWTSIEFDEMPHDRPALTDEQKQTVRNWIDDGAVWSVDYVDPAIYRGDVDSQRWISRLTIPEYIETVRTTFGVDIAADARRLLPQDRRADGFRNTAYNLTVDFEHVDAYAQLADLVVDRVDVAEFAKPYAKNRTHTDNNMRPLVEKMGRRILRGRLSADEIALFRGIASTAALAGADFEQAVGYVMRGMIQSPRFLYRIEDLPPADGEPLPFYRRDSYQTANRMSYTMWGGPPDAELMRAAEDGELLDVAGIGKQLDRMWQDPRCIDRSIEFVTEWLNLNRLENMNPERERFPNWRPVLASDMRRETIDTFRELVWEQQRPLVDLVRAPFTYASPRLARHYGIPPQDKPWTRYDLSEVASRGGLLTHGSVLTIGGDDGSMVTRGLFVLQDLLFSEVGDPPPGTDTTPVPTEAGVTHRVVATQRVESESCGGCHSRFEPLAFAFEKYDGLGSFREVDEHGNDLREDGEILFPGEADPVQYKTAAEMMDLLAESDRVAQCITRKVIQFALARPLDAADARSVREVYNAAGGKSATYQSIMTQLLTNETLR